MPFEKIKVDKENGLTSFRLQPQIELGWRRLLWEHSHPERGCNRPARGHSCPARGCSHPARGHVLMEWGRGSTPRAGRSDRLVQVSSKQQLNLQFLGLNVHGQYSCISFCTHRMDENTSFLLEIKLLGNHKKSRQNVKCFSFEMVVDSDIKL